MPLRLLYLAAGAALLAQLAIELRRGNLASLPAVAFALACVAVAGLGEWRIARERRQALDPVSATFGENNLWTYEHSTRVADYAQMIGRELGLDDVALTRLAWAARLHDIGKVAVDDAVLNKRGKLTDAEFNEMKRHPEVSARILSAFGCDLDTIEIVRCHHERWDGRGYLRRECHTVPIEAFVIGIADAYDAMTSNRPYRRAMSDEVALAEIHRNLGTQFHPRVGAIFLRAMGYDEQHGNATLLSLSEVGSAGPDRATDEVRRDDDVAPLEEAA